MNNPCLRCGACCAFFRATFYYAECDDVTPGGVPVELTEDFNQWRRVMKGTGHFPPRCVALAGTIGREGVGCSIHPRRSEVCRAFRPSFDDGVTPNIDCDRARAHHGLPPLTPADWLPDPVRPDDDRPPSPESPLPRAA